MTDIFGIGAGVMGSVRVYFQSARRTGRTIAMIESVKSGDRIVFMHDQERRRVEGLLKERGIEGVKCIVIDPKDPGDIFRHATSQGRTIFDHSWVERFYMNHIEDASQAIAHFQRESSGYGQKHIETRRAAIERSRWPE